MRRTRGHRDQHCASCSPPSPAMPRHVVSQRDRCSRVNDGDVAPSSCLPHVPDAGDQEQGDAVVIEGMSPVDCHVVPGCDSCETTRGTRAAGGRRCSEAPELSTDEGISSSARKLLELEGVSRGSAASVRSWTCRNGAEEMFYAAA